jgi:uncharacterized protein
MVRPFKCRNIHFSPDYLFFKPAGIPAKKLELVTLTMDEFEAVRLADLEGLYQEEAAKQLQISRQTFGNIISSAHHKIAEALIQGKLLKIKGGHVSMPRERKFSCYNCNHQWSVPFGTSRPQNCPGCQSSNIHRSEDDRGFNFHGRGRGRNFRHRRINKTKNSEV